jgi:hypothetical protein
VGGGVGNTASGGLTAVAGGISNTASGLSAAVPGGTQNIAQGRFSFAAGNRAHALHEGAFVWSSSAGGLASTAAGQFSVQADGGTRIFSSGDVGVQLAPGGNSWLATSDRALKENLTPIDGRQILDRLSGIQIAEWNLNSQDPAIRHLGPTAQDFYAAFGLGEDERYIGAVDADGVALAAIQGLHHLVQEQQEQIAKLEARLTMLERVQEVIR